jgi:hypothetical protein
MFSFLSSQDMSKCLEAKTTLSLWNIYDTKLWFTKGWLWNGKCLLTSQEWLSVILFCTQQILMKCSEKRFILKILKYRDVFANQHQNNKAISVKFCKIFSTWITFPGFYILSFTSSTACTVCMFSRKLRLDNLLFYIFRSKFILLSCLLTLSHIYWSPAWWFND